MAPSLRAPLRNWTSPLIRASERSSPQIGGSDSGLSRRSGGARRRE
jgi:hypothetical protein